MFGDIHLFDRELCDWTIPIPIVRNGLSIAKRIGTT
jgi:hypothetical protein